jgi:hypothetical protein
MIGVSAGDTTLGTMIANLGMADTRFAHPVFIGDTLRTETTVAEKRESRSRPDAGIVVFDHRCFNQRAEEVSEAPPRRASGLGAQSVEQRAGIFSAPLSKLRAPEHQPRAPISGTRTAASSKRVATPPGISCRQPRRCRSRKRLIGLHCI